jgi:NAD(P)-dependent dehydrogenase (short-subunit alcohol dehydrogenase family)
MRRSDDAVPNAGSLNKRRALITGAGAGIGREIALLFAREGADIAAFSLEGDLDALGRDISELGRRYVSLVGDVTQPDDVAAIVAAAGAQLGGIDILINNAGIAIIEPALETTLANWNKTLAINLTGAFLCAQAVAPAMIEQRFGRIINISSQASLIALPGHIAYTASKCGINAITHVLALEWGKFGVTTNAVAPTVVNTELGKAVWSDPAKADPMRAMIPVGRFAEPLEIAQAVLYLATDAAAMVNGHILCIDGGATIH